MINLITKYQNFVFEAVSTDTQISTVRLEISKLEDQIKEAKTKMTEAKKSSPLEINQLKAESEYLTQQSQIYGKMIPLLNTLKSKIDQKASELKG